MDKEKHKEKRKAEIEMKINKIKDNISYLENSERYKYWSTVFTTVVGGIASAVGSIVMTSKDVNVISVAIALGFVTVGIVVISKLLIKQRDGKNNNVKILKDLVMESYLREMRNSNINPENMGRIRK